MKKLEKHTYPFGFLGVFNLMFWIIDLWDLFDIYYFLLITGLFIPYSALSSVLAV